MEVTEKVLKGLQRRLKIGSHRDVHLNAIPANSRYKFDINRLSNIEKNIPNNFITSLLSEKSLRFRISWKDNISDINTLFEAEQTQLVRIAKAFENLINQTETIESEKGINTFGFGFPILARRDKADDKLTVAPILIWSLRIKQLNEFNTWEILRNEEDPVYINEVLINHLNSDINVEIEQIPSEMLDDGIISRGELIEICSNLIKKINATSPDNLKEILSKKLNKVVSIGDKAYYEKLPLSYTQSVVEMAGLYSIFEVQKQNIIDDYSCLLQQQEVEVSLDNLEGHVFQSISSVDTDPSQQNILHSLGTARNVLIQGPPGTGKSQTLTAVLINALENQMKTIVVCEKKTALEVLYDSLAKKGLAYNCVLIRDILKDRKTVVDSVRERAESFNTKTYRYNSSKENLENVIRNVQDLISKINTGHREIDRKIFGNNSWTDIVGCLLKELKKSDEDCNLRIKDDIFNYSRDEFHKLLDVVQNGQSLYNHFLTAKTDFSVNPKKIVGTNPYIIEKDINDDFNLYSNHLNLIKFALEACKKEFEKLRAIEFKKQVCIIWNTIKKIKSSEDQVKSLILTVKNRYFTFRRKELEKEIEDVRQIVSEINFLIKNNRNNPDIDNKVKIDSPSYRLLSIFSRKKRQTISTHYAILRCFTKLETCLEEAIDFQSISPEDSLIDKEKTLEVIESSILKLKQDFEAKIEAEFSSFKLHSVLETKAKPLQNLQSAIDCSKDEARMVLESIKSDFDKCLDELESCFLSLTKDLWESKDLKIKCAFDKSFIENKVMLLEVEKKIKVIETNFHEVVKGEFRNINLLKTQSNCPKIQSLSMLQERTFDLVNKIRADDWVNEKLRTDNLYYFLIDLESLIKKKEDYFRSKDDLFIIAFRWFQFYHNLTEREKLIIEELKKKKDWHRTFLVFYLNSLLISMATTNLPTNDEDRTKLDIALCGVEKEQLQYIKGAWLSRQKKAVRKFEQDNNGLSVENLYNKRSSSRFKRLSLRHIVQKDIDLFTIFFPIILTTPEVASNLFKGKIRYFDIVIFDEASQLRLEDNLPALLKGKQIVIAGDEHQMPPSNYFNKVFDGSVEDEDDIEEEEKNDDRMGIDKDDILLSCESLLDFGLELNFQKKYLDFHYRSRHPFLIDFSNHAFYNKRLRPLPNNFDYIPIKYIPVNGTFSQHTNEAEAEIILSILEKNINRLPNGEYPTVGIATFNIAQRNLIKCKILERQKFAKYTEFNNKIQELEAKGLFIKNLENIQGDERDVIILSTTYGIGKDGRFTQRFGPLNHSKGYKLLNVIITRAKYKIYCCSSIPENIFMDYKGYLTLEGSNNKRAVLYAYLAYCKAVSERDNDSRLSVLKTLDENVSNSIRIDATDFGELESPFEEEVYQSLIDYFGKDKLIPQLQFAGFRIDIVYDFKIDGKPKVAIECDGAKYHSSHEAYLYDMYRQKILENHGFVFHRIWSTNWWRNPSRELARLISFIKHVEAMPNCSKDYSSIALAFTDDVEISNEDNVPKSFINIEREIETIHTLEHTVPNQEKDLDTVFVTSTSKVEVKYMNSGKDINVQLVPTDNVKPDALGDVHRISCKSPLAISLLGHKVGDILKIGNLENFVEIIKVES